VTLPDLYLDEDTQSDALIAALRSRGINLQTTSEAGRCGRTDDEQLRFAASFKRVLVTSNIADFARLHAQWLHVGREHHGNHPHSPAEMGARRTGAAHYPFTRRPDEQGYAEPDRVSQSRASLNRAFPTTPVIRPVSDL